MRKKPQNITHMQNNDSDVSMEADGQNDAQMEVDEHNNTDIEEIDLRDVEIKSQANILSIFQFATSGHKGRINKNLMDKIKDRIFLSEISSWILDKALSLMDGKTRVQQYTGLLAISCLMTRIVLFNCKHVFALMQELV